MTVKQHVQLLAYSFVTWLVFYLIGLPQYYQQWPGWAKVLIVILVTVLYFPVTRYSLTRFWDNGLHVVNACWLALYLTIPLFIYDYLLLGVYKGLGLGFVKPYWYLTFFYFSFWLQFPYVAWRMGAASTPGLSFRQQ